MPTDTPTIVVEAVQFTPGTDSVMIACRVRGGIFDGQPFMAPTTQTALGALATTAGRDTWGDPETLTEAQAAVDARGGGITVALYTPPPPAADAVTT